MLKLNIVCSVNLKKWNNFDNREEVTFKFFLFEYFLINLNIPFNNDIGKMKRKKYHAVRKFQNPKKTEAILIPPTHTYMAAQMHDLVQVLQWKTVFILTKYLLDFGTVCFPKKYSDIIWNGKKSAKRGRVCIPEYDMTVHMYFTHACEIVCDFSSL